MQLKVVIGVLLVVGCAVLGTAAVQQVAQPDGTIATIPTCDTTTEKLRYAAGTWSCVIDQAGGAAGASLPAGAIVLVATGTCPIGFTEVTALDGRTPIGTLAANANIGATGGSDNLTPAGSVSAPTFVGTPFTDIINHTHTVTVTDPGHTHTQASHTHTQSVNSATTGGSSGYTPDTSTGTSVTSGYSTGSATPVINSATTGITATSANPAGGVTSITPAGTIGAPAFTGNAADNRSAFTRVIFCEKG